MGNSALHWASAGGILHVMNYIISLSSDMVSCCDLNGWTPLVWAATGCHSKQKACCLNEQEDVIKLSLDRGANPCVTAKGLDREWSPVKVARYHGLSSRIIQLLKEKVKEKLETMADEDTWEESCHTSRKAAEKYESCDCCFLVSPPFVEH